MAFTVPVASSNSNGRSKHALALHQIHAAHACVSGRQQCFTVMLHSHVAQSCCVVMLYSHAGIARDGVNLLACCAAWCLAATLHVVKSALIERVGGNRTSVCNDFLSSTSCLLSDELTLAVFRLHRCQEQQR